MSILKRSDYQEENVVDDIANSPVDINAEKFEPHNIEGSDFDEDQSAFFEKLFSYRKVFLNENWDRTLFIDGKINSVEDNFIKVTCLMDEEKLEFKEKIFPKLLLSHIYPLTENKFIRVKISQKMGSIRYDFFDADGFDINKKAFTADDLWEDLENFEMDEPLK